MSKGIILNGTVLSDTLTQKGNHILKILVTDFIVTSICKQSANPNSPYSATVQPTNSPNSFFEIERLGTK
jgi:hypothetical protein